MKKFSAFAAIALCSFPLAASAQSADVILDRAVSAYAAMHSMRAEFRQTLTNPLTGNSSTTTGVLLRRQPNFLSVSFDNGDRVVADGASVWLYLPSTTPGQVIRAPIGGSPSAIFDPAGELLVSPRSRYTVTSGGSSSLGGRKAHVLNLKPKSASAHFTKVILWVDDSDGTVRQIEATDGNGLKRLISISKLTANATLPRTAFSFTPPKGVRVVSQSLQQID